MASQTGTLKFRQSDGTYTELYPKTTIAQVDGLQTQLDSINTSLQNKVDLINSYARQQIILNSFVPYAWHHVSQFDTSINAQIKNDATSLGLQWVVTKTSDNSFISNTELVIRNGENSSETTPLFLLIRNNARKATKRIYYATTEYVQQQIQGAIVASY